MEQYTKRMIYHEIVSDIIKGEYRQNGLLNERRLMEKYGTSKSIVREALVELCNEDILRSIPRYGYEIVILTETDVRNILQFRVMVEGQNLPIVLEKASPQELELLMLQEEKFSLHEEQDVFDAWDNNSSFHLQLLALGGNRYCYRQVKQSLSILKRAYAQFYWDKWRRIRFCFDSGRHISISDALKRGDLDTALQVLTYDINSFGSTL